MNNILKCINDPKMNRQYCVAKNYLEKYRRTHTMGNKSGGYNRILWPTTPDPPSFWAVE
jgi:hypothetical protein